MSSASRTRRKGRDRRAQHDTDADNPPRPRSQPRGRPRQRGRNRVWTPLELPYGPQTYVDIATDHNNAGPEQKLQRAARASSARRDLPPLRPMNSVYRDRSIMNPHRGVHDPTTENRGADKLRIAPAQHSDTPQAQASGIADWKQELLNTFGNALPTIEYVDAYPGMTDGEVVFAQHPNGDVLASQWSVAQFEWSFLGRYNRYTNSIEGPLADESIETTAIWEGFDRSSIAYFRLLAKQSEARVMKKRFGEKDVRAAFPHLQQGQRPTPAAPAAVDRKYDEAISPKTVPVTTTPDNAEHNSEAESSIIAAVPKSLLRPESQPFRMRPTYINQHTFDAAYEADSENVRPSMFTFRGRGAHSDVRFMARAQAFRPIYEQHVHWSGRDMIHPVISYQQRPYDLHVMQGPSHDTVRQGLMTQIPSYNTFRQEVSVTQFQHSPLQPESTAQHSASSDAGRLENIPTQIHQSSTIHPHNTPQQPSHSRASDDAATYSIDEDSPLAHKAHQLPRSRLEPNDKVRTAMHKTVMNMPQQAKERTRQADQPRTVLYDPLQAREQAHVSVSATTAPVTHILTRCVSPPQFGDMGHITPVRSMQQDCTVIMPEKHASVLEVGLKNSIPDIEWKRRPAELLRVSNPAMAPPISTPTFTGPYFADYCHTPAHQQRAVARLKKCHDEQINDWWWSGTNFARQEEFYQANVVSSKSQEATSMARSDSTQISVAGQTTDSPDLRRMLVPVFENLKSYVEGPAENQRRGFNRQAPEAPAWAIDHGPAGNSSFFDWQWQPKYQRVQRDARYQAHPSPKLGRGTVAPVLRTLMKRDAR